MPELKIATWNVNGIRARSAQVIAFIEQESPDVLCLQELKATPDQLPEGLQSLADYWSYWHGMKGYSGVSVHVRKELAFDAPRFWHPEFDHQARIVVADLPGLSVASVYVPNGGKDFSGKMGFLGAMAAYVGEARSIGRQLIVCGDLNVALTPLDVHPKERDPSLVGQRPDEQTLLARILADGDLTDVGRAMDRANDSLFTWWAPWRNMRERNIGWRIDYVLASSALAGRAEFATSMRAFGTSDHAPVIVRFRA